VLLISPFAPSPGQSFEIIDVGGLPTGEFSGFGEGDLVGTFGVTNLLITCLGSDGNDVTLLAALPGDFDMDGDVDGRDFLEWQRNGSPDPLSSTDLTLWQTQYGLTATPGSATRLVPEPYSATQGLILLLVGLSCISRNMATAK